MTKYRGLPYLLRASRAAVNSATAKHTRQANARDAARHEHDMVNESIGAPDRCCHGVIFPMLAHDCHDYEMWRRALRGCPPW